MTATTKIPVDAAHSEDVHLSDYLVIVQENWRLIAAITACTVLIGVMYALIAKPVYRADVMIQVDDSTGSVNDALGQLASVFDTKQTASAEIELIRSRLVVGQTVRALHLDISVQPRYFPFIGSIIARHASGSMPAPPLWGLRQFAWGNEAAEVTRFDVPEQLYDVPFILIALPDNQFELRDKDDSVVLRGRVGQLLTFKSGEVRAIQVSRLVGRPGTEFVVKRASTLETVNKLQNDLVIAEKTKQSGVIGVSLDGPDSQRTAEIINAIASAYVQQNIDRKSAEAEHTIAFLDQQLPVLRKQLDDAENRYNVFRNRNGTVDLTEESRLLLQQIVDGKAKLADLQQRRIELAQRFTPSHPAIASLDAQITALQEQQGQLNKHVESLPNTEQSALRLLRDVRVNTQLYTNLLDSAQQLRILKAGQVGSVRVVDYAVAQDLPVKPKRLFVIAAALVLGVVAGVAVAFLRKTLLGGVEQSDEIERVLELPVYASIPHSETQTRLSRAIRRASVGQHHVLAAIAPNDVAIEAMRSLHTALQFGLIEASNNILVITGPRPAVGKSFTSVNLAAVLAASGKRVLLVDADMRRGDVHSYLGVSRQPGLSDVIAGAELDSALLHEVLPGLDLLPKGTLPPNPAELLMSRNFKALLDELGARYDLVIIDTPPILAVTDAALIGRHAGSTLLVVRHGRHPVPELLESVSRLRISGVTLKGALFTDVPKRRVGYGAYYSSYYGYESVSE
ncbi:polysaccharide biosynthesis tyrosine autokinase [Burkholderia vietnamiensis]|uniref:polysaccharide biosynthesis tyrosine autokinase n=1 Tax=Burkholderia vietnamiensis TaxID=60552 RepID=UPI00075E5E7C|nr:polysaccharide biosynthesis tyrosine autokinase [Burkholderia vietnamiensis]KVE95969.1 protein tyrosine kinase [Burkholderia vietnamiensis]KVF73589.1 protein tyrosine kinase [Burkholderia vietnamiensis]KVF86710.1 protein tyrosine kinase [Burkholderia vietnamiensis]KVF92890.1 protein tyrosine kinase [Burkholderia vietnamiensis]KVG04763.1 protein tyrosine kinase [Burkholderia vietnamiensis]